MPSMEAMLVVHPLALPAALAAEVAGEGGKFRAMHDQLHALAGELDPSTLLEAAKAVGS